MHLRKLPTCLLIWLRWNMVLIARNADAACRNGAKEGEAYLKQVTTARIPRLGSMITIYTASNMSLNGVSLYVLF